MNAAPGDRPGGLRREVISLRARCSNLRNWCRLLLEDPAAAGVLPEAVETELRTVPPEVSEPEGQAVVALLARGGNVPPTHPLAPTDLDVSSLEGAIACRSAECDRLRAAFFAIYDRLHPGDDLTDEYFLQQRAQGAMVTMAEALAEIDREFGGKS